jgi:hypothetical protein
MPFVCLPGKKIISDFGLKRKLLVKFTRYPQNAIPKMGKQKCPSDLIGSLSNGQNRICISFYGYRAADCLSEKRTGTMTRTFTG